jgi:hypothetical protein
VRTWPVWQLPGWLVIFIIAVSVADGAGIMTTAAHATVRVHDLVLFALLLAASSRPTVGIATATKQSQWLPQLAASTAIPGR